MIFMSRGMAENVEKILKEVLTLSQQRVIV